MSRSAAPKLQLIIEALVAILSTAMYATVKNGGPVHAQRVLYRPDLVFDVAFISSLLKTEFVYGPGGLERNLEATVKQLQDANVISIENEDDMDGDQSIPAAGSWERRKWVSLSPEERRFGRETFGENRVLSLTWHT